MLLDNITMTTESIATKMMATDAMTTNMTSQLDIMYNTSQWIAGGERCVVEIITDRSH